LESFTFIHPLIYSHPRGANSPINLAKDVGEKKPRYLLKYHGIEFCNLFCSIGDIQREPMGTRGTFIGNTLESMFENVLNMF